MAPRRPKPVPSLLEQLKASLLASIADAQTPDMNGRTQPAAVASLSKELRAVQAEIDQGTGKGEGSKADDIADDLAKRRAARVAGSTDRAPAARRGQPRRSNGNHRTG